MPSQTAQIIGSCGHRYMAVIDLADWPGMGAFQDLWEITGPIVKDTVPCPTCRTGAALTNALNSEQIAIANSERDRGFSNK